MTTHHSEHITDHWQTLTPDGKVWGTYASLQEAVENQPKKWAALIKMHQQLANAGVDTTKIEPLGDYPTKIRHTRIVRHVEQTTTVDPDVTFPAFKDVDA